MKSACCTLMRWSRSGKALEPFYIFTQNYQINLSYTVYEGCVQNDPLIQSKLGSFRPIRNQFGISHKYNLVLIL